MSDNALIESIARLVPQGSRVLDLGCGNEMCIRDSRLAWPSAALSQSGAVAGFDVSYSPTLNPFHPCQTCPPWWSSPAHPVVSVRPWPSITPGLAGGWH